MQLSMRMANSTLARATEDTSIKGACIDNRKLQNVLSCALHQRMHPSTSTVLAPILPITP